MGWLLTVLGLGLSAYSGLVLSWGRFMFGRPPKGSTARGVTPKYGRSHAAQRIKVGVATMSCPKPYTSSMTARQRRSQSSLPMTQITRCLATAVGGLVSYSSTLDGSFNELQVGYSQSSRIPRLWHCPTSLHMCSTCVDILYLSIYLI